MLCEEAYSPGRTQLDRRIRYVFFSLLDANGLYEGGKKTKKITHKQIREIKKIN